MYSLPRQVAAVHYLADRFTFLYGIASAIAAVPLGLPNANDWAFSASCRQCFLSRSTLVTRVQFPSIRDRHLPAFRLAICVILGFQQLKPIN